MKTQWISCFVFCFSFTVVAQFGPQQIIDPDIFGITKIVTADLNNNGFQDLITSQKYHNNSKISIFLNSGLESFGSQVTISSNVKNSEGVAVGDLSGNGWKDIVAVSQNPNVVFWYPNSGGSFLSEIQLDSGLTMPEDVEIVDIDNDGLLDIVVLDHSNIVVYYNNGDDTFNKVTTPNDQFEYYAFSIADLDDDGFQDIIIGSGQVLVYMNDNGSFITHDVARSNSIVNQGFCFMIHTSDLDGNGTKDLIVDGHSGSDIRWYANDGNGFFTFVQTIENTLQCRSVTTADFNNDGSPDVFASLFQEGEVAWYANDGQGNFGSKQLVSLGTAPKTVATAIEDLNNNGFIDVIWAHPFSFHMNESPLSLGSDLTQPVSITVAPNPFKEQLQIKTQEPASLSVFDIQGRCLYKNILIVAGINTINLQLTSQLYFFQFTTPSGRVVTKMLRE